LPPDLSGARDFIAEPKPKLCPASSHRYDFIIGPMNALRGENALGTEWGENDFSAHISHIVSKLAHFTHPPVITQIPALGGLLSKSG
jgi:hypothetical protein